MTMGAVAAIVTGKLQQYLQPRTLVLIGGALFGAGLVLLGSVHSLAAVYAFAALAGFGMGVVYPGATMSNLIRFYPDRSGLASGLLSAGAGLGAVVWAPLAVALIERFDLAWALRILGVFFFIALAALSRVISTAPAGYVPDGRTPPQERASAAARPVRDVDWRGMVRTPQFIALFLLFIAGTLSGMMVIGHGSPIAQQILGITPGAAGAIVEPHRRRHGGRQGRVGRRLRQDRAESGVRGLVPHRRRGAGHAGVHRELRRRRPAAWPAWPSATGASSRSWAR